MNDRQIGEKELERMRLYEFLESYEFTVGQELREVFYLPSERPDFICVRDEGELIGVELTRVMQHPHLSRDLDIWEAMEIIHHAIETKEKKRSEPDWKLPKSTILVLEVMDTPVDILTYFLTRHNLQDDFSGHGFIEIWIANHEPVEAHGTVELFGLYPQEWWGPHERWNAWAKPYG